MPIDVACPACDYQLLVKDELAGRRVRCPECGKTVGVPDGEEDRPVRRRRRPEKSGSLGVVIALAAGGVGLVIAVIVGVIVLRMQMAPPPAPLPLPDRPVAGAKPFPQVPPIVAGENVSLIEARRGFKTRLVSSKLERFPVPTPPAALFSVVRYDSPVGALPAYLTPDPKDSKKWPAIIWITGGDCNSIDDGCFKEWPPANDQAVSAFRKAGIVVMFPCLRGGNDGPGTKEGFLGEVDDVLAAADFLAKQEYVDSKRIYLGGHSTGGTMALLVAECSDRFRAVFSFGPVDDVGGYGPEYKPFDQSNPRELDLRSPDLWLAAIKSPTFVFEGTIRPANLDSLQNMARSSRNPNAHFLAARGADHYSILAPTTRLIAERILRDDGATCNLSFTEQEVSAAFGR